MKIQCIKREFLSIKCFSLIILSLQTTATVLMMRYSRTLKTNELTTIDKDDLIGINQGFEDQYLISVAIFLAESSKIVLSTVVLFIMNGEFLYSLMHIFN